MATNTPSGTPVPTMGDSPNVPADFLKLATYLEPITTPRFTDDTTASAGLPGRLIGQGAIIGGVRKVWNGASWVEASMPPIGAAGAPIAGTVPPSTQLKIVGGMNVFPTNVFGQIRLFTGFTTCLLSAWCFNGDPGGTVIISNVDVANSDQTSVVFRFQTPNGTFLGDGSLVRMVWGAIGL